MPIEDVDNKEGEIVKSLRLTFIVQLKYLNNHDMLHNIQRLSISLMFKLLNMSIRFFNLLF
jgi:hypothetical protein